MIISEDTKSVVQFLNDYAKGGLRKMNDVEIIFELAATYNGADELNRLVFAGKSVWNISSKLKKIIHGTGGIDLLQKEMLRNVEDMKKWLRIIIEYGDNKSKERFDVVYFAETSGAIKNIIDLAHDLAVFKDIQSESRRSSQ